MCVRWGRYCAIFQSKKKKKRRNEENKKGEMLNKKITLTSPLYRSTSCSIAGECAYEGEWEGDCRFSVVSLYTHTSFPIYVSAALNFIIYSDKA